MRPDNGRSHGVSTELRFDPEDGDEAEECVECQKRPFSITSYYLCIRDLGQISPS